MARQEIEEAFQALEHAPSRPLEALDGLERLEDLLSSEDKASQARLQELSSRTPEPVSGAIRRAMLRLRRESVDWDVLTTTSQTGEGPPAVSRVLRQAKQALTAPDNFARVAFLERAMAEERFAVGTVLTVQIRVEKDPTVLASMARALGMLGGPVSIPSLKATLQHSDPSVRKSTVQGLGYQRGIQAVGLLLHALADPDPDVKYKALEVLESSSPRAVLEALEAQPEADPGQVQAIEYVQGLKRYPPAIAYLKKRMHSPVPALSAEALVVLAGYNDPDAEAYLEKLSVSTRATDQQIFARAQRAWSES